GMHKRIVAEAGLIAYGRGEAFDYILGEETPQFAMDQERLAIIFLLLANHPIISVNGNVAVLCPKELVELSRIIQAPLEINLFYRTRERELAIKEELQKAGAEEILGVDIQQQSTIDEISHQRRIVDSQGIAISDCVFVPLEDGDRTQALKRLGKKVVTVDLNPLSRTSLVASVSITNNITRAVGEMIHIAKELKGLTRAELLIEKSKLNNEKLLKTALDFMSTRLSQLAKDSLTIKNEDR
ncbi:MAG: phosphopantothenate/pantothenate synthetase, partial [Candidatus Omnitrophica bacterium]|nr:phosphopantothenate/pantothenate synthetase [Candidatus Omnitrophota bacterium]